MGAGEEEEMTFKEFKKWANERACDGQWGMSHVLLTQDIYVTMQGTNIFNRRKIWKQECESRAIAIIEMLKEQKNG